jgi:thiamine-monophosphate kinase
MSTGPGPDAGEFGLIDWIRRQVEDDPRVPLGIGDDCAVLRQTTSGELLVTTDMLLDGRHFQLSECGAEAVGAKAVGANLSDIAAMAGKPVAAFVSVALPRGHATEIAERLLSGMRPLLDAYSVALAGGDTNAWDGPLVVSVTLLGEPVAPGPVLRRGAEPGDVILVTGPLGGSLLGRHLAPVPRIREAITLHQAVPIKAMIDISDGLASDLSHILQESGGLGAILDAGAIPVHDDALRLSRRDGATPLDHALSDGEDFELCLAVSPEAAAQLLAAPPAEVRLHRVGTVQREPGLWLDDGTSRRPLRPRGFDHLAGA